MMNACSQPFCHSITTDIHVNGGWMRVCPVCGKRTARPADLRIPTQADKRAGMAYAKVQTMEYADAERLFREAYVASTDDALRAGYIWWAVICCYGIEYVEKIEYKDVKGEHTKLYIPQIVRFPLNRAASDGCKTLALFDRFLSEHPHTGMSHLLNEMKELYKVARKDYGKPGNRFDVFIAWHDQSDKTQCYKFAKELHSKIRNQDKRCFFSSVSLGDYAAKLLLWEPKIYAALATAKVFVIVVDDYDAMGQGFLGCEIRRMGLRKKRDDIPIIIVEMSNPIGTVPEFMKSWQIHFPNSKYSEDKIALVSKEVLEALPPPRNRAARLILCAIMIALALIVGFTFAFTRLQNGDRPPENQSTVQAVQTVQAMTQPPEATEAEVETPQPEETPNHDAPDDLRAEISQWQSRGLAPAEVIARIREADARGIDLSAIARDEIYEAAALASAGSTAQHMFVDWDGDGYAELLALDASGVLSLYGTEGTWGLISSVDTGLAGASYAIVNEAIPIIVILSADQDAFGAVGRVNGMLSALFSESDIRRYRAEGTTITFSRLLEGAAASYYDYTYEAANLTNRPVQTGIDWQPDDVPQPTNAASAVRRYFEARAYGIADEADLLVQPSDGDGFFTAERLLALPAPDRAAQINIAACLEEEKRGLFEVSYPSRALTIRTWVCAEYMDGWRLTGAAESYADGLSADDVDYFVPLLGLNAETTNAISQKGVRKTCRVLVPCSGRVVLRWQSGSAEGRRNAHNVTMVRDSLTGTEVFNFQLKPSLSVKYSKDQYFVAAGVYYVTVTALVADAEPYHMTLSFTADPYVELEGNDITAKATPIKINQAYSGALYSEGDVDCYAFTLDAASAVDIGFNLPDRTGSGGSTSTHNVNVIRAADGVDLISSLKVSGKALSATIGNLYLSEGTYWVTVAKGAVHSDERYALTVHAEPRDDIGAEPNNTTQTATVVPVNADICASLEREDDVDFYAFTLEAASAVNIAFDLPDHSGERSSTSTHVVGVYSAADGAKQIAPFKVSSKALPVTSGNLYLSAGTYWVRIAKGTDHSNERYALTIHAESLSPIGAEPNNTPQTATAVPVNADIRASIELEGDVDYYTFTLSGDAIVRPHFTFKATDEDTRLYALTILDSRQQSIHSVNIKGKEIAKVITPVVLSAGTYYLRVENEKFVRQDYTLHLASQAVDRAEREANDSEASATDLVVGQPITGVLTSNKDVDCYRVSFSEPTTVTLNFSFEQSKKTDAIFELAARPQERESYKPIASLSGDSGGIKGTVPFPAGECYIQVKPAAWSGRIYTIALEQ